MTKRASALVLILANLIPLAGVFLFQWDVLAILLLYWAESVVVGVINVFRMIACRTDNILHGFLPQLAGQQVPGELGKNLPKIPVNAFRFFLVPFFVLHYGGFCFGHLMAVVGFFGDGSVGLSAGSSLAKLWQSSFWIGVAAIFGSHLFSFFTNYIGGGEYKRASLFLLMHRPYGRIIVMHVAIVFGAGLVMWLGSPLPMLMILIVTKTVLDIRLHEKERGKLA
jgi:hypothetical protein